MIPLWPRYVEHEGDQDKALLGIRPEDIRVYDQAPDGVSFPAKVSVVEPLGQETILDLDFGDDIIKATIPPTQFVSENQDVFLTFDVSKLHLFDIVTRKRFYSSDKQAALVAVGS